MALFCSISLRKSVHLVEKRKRRIWYVHINHILYNHYTAMGQVEKSNAQTPKHAALKNIIKSRNGQMSSFEDFRGSLSNFSELSTE